MNQAPKKRGGEQEVPVTQADKDVKQATPDQTPDVFEDMEQMWDKFFSRGWMHPFWREMPTPFAGRMAPRTDIIKRDHEIIVRMQLPGVDKKDVDVSISDNTVTIKGQTSHEEKEEHGDYYRRECSSGSFSRSFTLPSDVDGTKAKATFKNGVLELTIPKNEESKQHRIRIE